jgi:flagellar FliL protein
MSDKVETEGKPKKGKGLVGKLLIGTVLLGAGGGGAFGMMQAGMLGGGGGGGEHAKVDNNPRLVRKGEEDPYAPKSENEKEGASLGEIHGDGGSEYQTSYYSFSEDFTSNLKNSDALLQVALAASTHRDGRVLLWMKKHELAIRSRMLEVLADTPEEDVYTLVGKEKLQKRMTAAINKVLTDNEGFGGVDAVYFRNFIIQ